MSNDKISISDDGFHGSSTISYDVNSSSSGRHKKLETVNEDKGKTYYSSFWVNFFYFLYNIDIDFSEAIRYQA